MVKARRRFRGIDHHPAYGIVHPSLLHGLIVGLFGQFDLCLSALSAPKTNGCRTRRKMTISSSVKTSMPVRTRVPRLAQIFESREETARAFAFLSVSVVNSASMRLNATLPVILLLLVAGQLSADFCMAQCQSMRMAAPACAMQEMSHGHCASCKHASANSTNASLSTPGTCSGQTCKNVLGLAQSRPNSEIRPSVTAVSIDILPPPVLEDRHPVRLRDARSTRSIPPFDPLISSLRI
jgi:hypothetical protein